MCISNIGIYNYLFLHNYLLFIILWQMTSVNISPINIPGNKLLKFKNLLERDLKTISHLQSKTNQYVQGFLSTKHTTPSHYRLWKYDRQWFFMKFYTGTSEVCVSKRNSIVSKILADFSCPSEPENLLCE